MAGEATIGALRVVLGADTAKFEDNLKSAIGSLEDFGKKALTIATGIQLSNIFEQAFKGVVESITGAIDAAEKLSKASQKFGIPVETLSALSNAAALSGVSIEELGGSLSRLSKNMISAEAPTSAQTSAFAALGISVKDTSGHLKSADDILLSVADSFSSFRDGTTKTALAVAIFGRAGADLIPVLDKGSAGIKDMLDRVKQLNPNLDVDTLAAEQFKDALKELAIAKDAIILRLVGSSGLLQLLQGLAKSFTETASNGEKLAQISRDVATAIQVAATAMQVFFDLLKIAATPTLAFAQALYQITQGNFSAALAAINDGFASAVGSSKDAAAAIGKLTTSAIDFTYVGLSDELIKTVLAQKALAAAPPFDPDRDKKLEAFNKELAKLHGQALDVGGVFAGQLAPGFLSASAGMEILKGQVTIIGDQFVRLGPLAQKLNVALLQLAGAKLTQDFLTPWQQFEQQLQRLDLLLASNAINLDTYTKAAAKSAADMQVSYATVFNRIATDAANAFRDLAAVNHEFAGAAKAAAIAQATIATYLGAANAYAQAALVGGPVLAAVAAAVAVAAGLANVAKIVATPFATGGSFTVPGGIGGLDRTMAPIALAPGERVDVTPASQVRDRGGRPREIVLSGIGPRDFFTGDMLRGLVDALNQGQRDGYRLKVAG